LGPKIKLETLLHGKYQHIKEYVASTCKIQENNDDLVIQVVDTPENPENTLAELEETLQEEVTVLMLATLRCNLHGLSLGGEYSESTKVIP
jgi:hypothetical protein